MEDEAAEQPSLNVDTETTLDGSYAWPVVHYDIPPYRTCHFFSSSSETCPRLRMRTTFSRVSNDDSCFLTCADDNTLHVFTLPYGDNDNPVNSSASVTDADSYAANIVTTEGEISVYDYC